MVVILAVPFGLMGSFLFAKCFGLENNIYIADRFDYADWIAFENRHLAD